MLHKWQLQQAIDGTQSKPQDMDENHTRFDVIEVKQLQI